MRYSRKSGCAQLVLMASPLLSLGAPCVNAETVAGYPALEEVVVTAQKRQSTVQDTPISISAFSGKDLDEQGIDNAADLVRFVPGADFSTNGGTVSITIRGVGSDGLSQPKDDASVAAHLDGVYLSRPAALSALFYDIERVEVLRGPQGTLYGRNATGGSLNIITNKPTNEFGGSIEGSLGNYDMGLLKGWVNVPLVDEKLALRISGQTHAHYGYADKVNDSLNDGDDADENALRARMEWHATDSFTVGLETSLYKANTVGPNRTASDTRDLVNVVDANGVAYGSVTGAIIFDPVATAERLGEPKIADDERRTSYNPAQPKMKIETDTYILDMAWQINDQMTLKSLTGYTDFSQTVNRFAPPYEPDLQLNSTFNFTTKSDTTSQELNLNYEGDGGLSITTGLFYYEDDGTNPFQQVSIDPNRKVSIYSKQHVKTDSYAGYFETTIPVFDKFAVTGGIRYTDEKKTGGSSTQIVFPGGFVLDSPLDAKYDNDSTDYKVGLEWTPTDDSLVYANFSTAFKSGGFNTGAPLTVFYEPETIDAWQAGWKASWLDNRIQSDIAAYYYDYDDLQITQVLGTSLETQNAANAEVQGVELEVQAAVTEALWVRAFATFVDSRYEDSVIADIIDQNALGQNVFGEIDISDNSLRFTPDSSFGLSVAYSLDLFGGDLTSRVNFYWQDDTYARPHGLTVDKIDSYTNTGVNIRYTDGGDRYFLEAWGKNLEDDTVLSARFVNPTHLSEYKPPRTYGVTAGYNF